MATRNLTAAEGLRFLLFLEVFSLRKLIQQRSTLYYQQPLLLH